MFLMIFIIQQNLFLKKIKYKTNFLIKDINSAAKYIKQSYKGHTESDF